MGKQFPHIEAMHRDFILQQRIFFVASAAAEGRVNVSPKDGAALRILTPNRVIYLDQTGSGNETAAHLRANGRLTIMFCAFTGAPMILRLYGQGKILRRGSAGYRDLLSEQFPEGERPGARHIVILEVDLVQTSCGFGVPLFEYVDERPTLTRWAIAKGEEGLEEYRQLKNAVSIDGFPAGLQERS
ncbi:MAG TPA: pyridoxamine 5'-phosphate oxidase family protein [Acidobacteriaceae bacterium]|nr:pyridoxamine 5'-phosphate oxidase family protein [Acidobacteriaceae bacterium]